MKNISVALKTHLQQEVTTITTCMLMKLVWRKIPVVSISNASSAVVNTLYDHKLINGQYISFENVAGMTQVNESPHTTPWKIYTVTVIDNNTFSINANTTGYPSHTANTGCIREIAAFTDNIKPLYLDSIYYQPYEGFTRSASTSATDMSVDTIDLTGIVGQTSGGVTITAGDVLAGRFDSAELRVFQVNYEDLSMGRMWLKRGWLGNVSVEDDVYTAEVRGMTQLLQTQTLELYSASCRYDLGDTRCTFNLAGNMPDTTPATVSGSVTGLSTNRIFFDTNRSETTDDVFKHGLLTWVTGDNSGLSKEIKSYTFISSALEFTQAMPFDIQIGDTYVLYKGCDKSFNTCKTKFSNGTKFGGYPFLPGEDKIIKVIKAKDPVVK